MSPRSGPLRRAVRHLTQASASAVVQLSGTFFGALIALAVIRRGSEATWGRLVALLVVVQLVASVVGWGQREYLVRAFSAAPHRLGERWRSVVATRLLLCALLSPGAFWLPWDPATTAAALAWCLGQVLAQSMEPVIVFRRDFVFAAAVEIAGHALVLGLVVAAPAPPAALAVAGWFALSAWLRATALLARHRGALLGRPTRPELAYFARALPFFLITVTGMLQTRADLYAATWLLGAAELGRYQVLLNMLLLVQSGAAFLVAPWTRALYRVRHRTLVALSRRLFGAGVALVVVAIPAIHFALSRLYRIAIPAWVLAIGAALVLPTYFYVPSVYALFRHGRPSAVVRINALAALGSFGASLLLLPRLGLAGALVAAAVAQWAMLVAYVGLARAAARGHEAALP